MRTTLALAVVLIAAISATATDAAIVLGQGIGPVRLGDNLADVIKVLGNPRMTRVNPLAFRPAQRATVGTISLQACRA